MSDISCRQFHRIIFLLLLMVAIIFIIPRNVRGEEIYRYKDKDGTIVITDIPPHEEDIPSNADKSKSNHVLTPEELLHRGRDNALIHKPNQVENRQRKKVGSVDAGIYEVKVKKIGSNLYQDISTRMIIKTAACKELAGGDESQLDWYGSTGELYFKKTSRSCPVKKVFQN
jgi:hypothetical protein